MRSSIELIALDLDGTVLDSSSRVPAENSQWIQKAIDAGVEVIICTGRILSTAQVFRLDSGIHVPLICSNGANIYDAELKELREVRMTPEAARGVLDVAEREDLFHYLFDGSVLYANREEGPVKAYIERNEGLNPEDRLEAYIENSEQLKRRAERGACKIICVSEEPALLAKVKAELKAMGGVSVSSSWAKNIEIVAEGIDKGEALRWYAGMRGIPMESVMSMGDNNNDLEMLQVAGWPVAMGNATEDAIAVSKYRTLGHNECGVAAAIRRHVFNMEE